LFVALITQSNLLKCTLANQVGVHNSVLLQCVVCQITLKTVL